MAAIQLNYFPPRGKAHLHLKQLSPKLEIDKARTRGFPGRVGKF